MTIPDYTNRSLAELLSLSGRVAVVTGAGQGIGSAIARRLAEAGADVLVADLHTSTAEEVAADLASRGGGRVVAAKVDVTDSATLSELADRAVAEFGRLDIWVNNAGIFPSAPALEVTDEMFDHLLQVNVRGTWVGACQAAKRMSAGGVIVNLASITGFRGAPGVSAYSTSKHAVVGLTKNLALEFAPLGIRVVAIAPGPIDTPGVQSQLAPLTAAGIDVAKRMHRTLLGRAGQPDDVARMVVVLASDLAAWVTGEVLIVDAGSLAS